MTGPQRIQRKRTRGWRMPEGAVYVGRPTRWGNPFAVQAFGLDRSLNLFHNSVHGIWSPSVFTKDDSDGLVSLAYTAHSTWGRRFEGHPLENVRSDLAGLSLACWCPLDQPCHADVLLAAANPPTTPTPDQQDHQED